MRTGGQSGCWGPWAPRSRRWKRGCSSCAVGRRAGLAASRRPTNKDSTPPTRFLRRGDLVGGKPLVGPVVFLAVFACWCTRVQTEEGVHVALVLLQSIDPEP